MQLFQDYTVLQCILWVIAGMSAAIIGVYVLSAVGWWIYDIVRYRK